MIKNPYIPGQPVKSKDMFFGREDVFDFLRQYLAGAYQDNTVMLYGQRRTGKTSILYQLLLDPGRIGPDYVPVLISLEGLQDVETNAGIFLEIAAAIAVKLKLDIPAANKFDSANHYFRHTFLGEAKQHLGKQKLLLMIDEYEVLEASVDNPHPAVNTTLFHQLRHLMQHYDWLSFILVGSHKLEELNPAYWKEFTDTIYQTISFLDAESAGNLIQEPARRASIAYNAQAVEQLLALSGCHPYFLQALCQSAFARGISRGAITEPDVEQAVESCLISLKNGYESIWREVEKDEKVILAAIASLDAAEVSLSEIVGQLDYFKVNWKLERITEALRQLAYKDILKEIDRVRRQYCVPFFEKCVAVYHPLDRLLDDLGIERKKDAELIGDSKVLKAKQYLRDAEEHARLNDKETAEKTFELAMQVCPYHADGWLRFGKFYEAEQQNDQALEIYRNILKQHPNYVDASNAIGLLLKKSCQYEEALRQFQFSLEIQADNNVALANIDEIKQRFSQLQAEELEIQQQQAALGVETARVYNKTNPNVALRMLEVVLDAYPNHREALRLMGQIKLKEDQLPEALKIYEQAYEQEPNPTSEIGREYLAVLARVAENAWQGGFKSEAVQHYEKIKQILGERYDEDVSNKKIWQEASTRLDEYYLSDEAV